MAIALIARDERSREGRVMSSSSTNPSLTLGELGESHDRSGEERAQCRNARSATRPNPSPKSNRADEAVTTASKARAIRVTLRPHLTTRSSSEMRSCAHRSRISSNDRMRSEPGTEQTILQPPDCQLAGVKLTCSLNTRTVTADPKPSFRTRGRTILAIPTACATSREQRFTLTAIGCGRSVAGPYCIDQCPERWRCVTVGG
jgi:hypothetical protein